MMRRTLYEVLMVHPLADAEVIAAVYRHLAKRYHPDRDAAADAQARMAEINEAYEILKDPGKRARYDEILAASGGGETPRDPRPRRAPTPTMEQAEGPHGEAGPPPPNPPASGSVLTFGRYRGWSLNQVARFDRDYLEWLSRTTTGRTYKQELEALLRRNR